MIFILIAFLFIHYFTHYLFHTFFIFRWTVQHFGQGLYNNPELELELPADTTKWAWTYCTLNLSFKIQRPLWKTRILEYDVCYVTKQSTSQRNGSWDECILPPRSCYASHVLWSLAMLVISAKTKLLLCRWPVCWIHSRIFMGSVLASGLGPFHQVPWKPAQYFFT